MHWNDGTIKKFDILDLVAVEKVEMDPVAVDMEVCTCMECDLECISTTVLYATYAFCSYILRTMSVYKQLFILWVYSKLVSANESRALKVCLCEESSGTYQERRYGDCPGCSDNLHNSICFGPEIV